MAAHDIRNTVKRIRNIMRKDEGIDGDAQRISQLSWMLFLKIYDELKESNEYELETTEYESIIPVKYRWRNWAIDNKDGKALTGDELIRFISGGEKEIGLFPTLKNLQIDETPPRSAIVKYVFTDAYNYMKDGILIRQVINELNENIDFDEYEDRHIFNEIYEELLKELKSAGSSGEFYTPREVTDFMTEMIAPKIGEIVADFACGTGGFLTSTISHIREKSKSQKALESIQRNVIGVEFKPLPYILCVTNMLLHDIDGTNITRGDSLGYNMQDFSEKDLVDVVLMNPPFGGEIKEGTELNCPASFRTKDTASLFMAMILHRLKKNGRVGIVLPDGFLFGADAGSALVNIKRKLLSECDLHTIVRLPSGLFYANITTNLLFFKKGTATKGIWYYQVPLPEGYRSFSKNKPFERKHLDSARSWWANRSNGDINAYYVPLSEIEKHNYDIDFKNPNIKTTANEATLQQMLDSASEKSACIANTVAELQRLLKGIEE